MQIVEIWMFLFLSFASIMLCQKIDCHWGTEYLCGDKCLTMGEYNAACYCGNDTITIIDAENYNCCHEKTCFKDIDGNVRCHDGLKQNWRVPCNGKCRQTGIHGYTTIPCEDHLQCVKAITLCKGVQVCYE